MYSGIAIENGGCLSSKMTTQHIWDKEALLSLFFRCGAGLREIIAQVAQRRFVCRNLNPELNSVPGHYTVQPTHGHKIRQNDFSWLPPEGGLSLLKVGLLMFTEPGTARYIYLYKYLYI